MLKGNSWVFIFLILLFGLGLFAIIFISPKPVSNTILFTVPKVNYAVNKEVEIPISLTGSKTPINVIKVDLKYPNSNIEVKEINISDNLPGVVVSRSIDQSIGEASITLGIPNPGINSSNFEVAKIKLICNKPGDYSIELLPKTSIIANNDSSSLLPHSGSELVLKFSQ